MDRGSNQGTGTETGDRQTRSNRAAVGKPLQKGLQEFTIASPEKPKPKRRKMKKQTRKTKKKKTKRHTPSISTDMER